MKQPHGTAGNAPVLDNTAHFAPFWATIMETAGIGLWDWEVDTGRVVFSRQWEALAGYGEGALPPTAEGWRSAVLPEDLPAAEAAVDRHLRGETGFYEAEFRLLRGDGSVVWTHARGVVTQRDEDGRPTRLAGAAQDITRTKQAEHALLALGGHLNLDAPEQAGPAAGAQQAEDSGYSQRLRDDIEGAISQLHHSEAFSRTMFEASPYVSVLFDHQLQLVDCNPMAVEFFGFADREDLLRGLMPLIHASIPEFQPDGRRSVPLAERFRSVIRTGSIELESQLLLNGRQVPLRVYLKKVPYKGSFAVAVYLMDLSSLREAKNELLHQDHLLRVVNTVANNLMSASPDGFETTVWGSMGEFANGVGAQRMYIWRNTEKDGRPACQQLYEWTADAHAQPQSLTLFEAGDENSADYEQAQSLYDTLSQGIHINIRAQDAPALQSQLFTQNNIQATLVIPVILQDSFWGFVGFDNCRSDRLFTDSEIKVLESGSIILVAAILRNELTKNLILAREEALASTRAKTDFLSRMSHEIRTPMNAIIGMNTIARKTRDYNKIQYCMEKIDDASGQLLEIINDILDMSKIESGRFEMTEAEFDFEKMMQGVFDVIQLRVEQNGQKLTVQFDSLFERMIICDELRLSQVVTNLLSNAVKFTPPAGEVTVRVNHREDENGVPVLHVEVEDTGIGISPDQQEKMFQSFEQGDGGLTRRYGGTGLGLAICKRIVQMLGGDIWVHSELGRGSTFVFELTFAWGQPLKSTIAKKQLPDDLRVLVVDDSADVRIYFSTLMEGFSLACDVADSGHAAVEMARRARQEGRPYRLVFVDWRMPGLGGTDTAREINEISGADTTLVMISAADWSEIEQEVAGFGVTEYLSKPILPSVLFNTILRLSGSTLVTPPQQPLADFPHWEEKNILLVEDLPINREIIHGILEDTGVHIDDAENGRVGVDMYLSGARAYDLILMDMQMPELDGLGATRQIRASGQPSARSVPILAMTANAFKEDVENCLAAGMNGHIAKPVDVDTLMEKLEQHLGKDS